MYKVVSGVVVMGVEHTGTGKREEGRKVCLLPWKQQGSRRDAPSQSLWRQTLALFGRGSHTCSPRSASLSAGRRAGTPGIHTGNRELPLNVHQQRELTQALHAVLHL